MSKTRSPIPEVLAGRSLSIARAAWVTTTLPLFSLAAFGLVRAYIDPQLVAISALSNLFEEFHLGLRLMITLALVGPFLAVAIIAVVVFSRRSRDPMALLLTATLLASYSFVTRGLVALDGIPVLEHAVSVSFAISMVLLTLTLALFPNGVIYPRWSGWLPAAMAVLVITGPNTGTLLMTVIEQEGAVTVRTQVVAYGWAAILLFGLVAQVYRYRRVSTDVERQQTKWVIAPLGLTMVVLVGLLVSSVTAPDTPDSIAGWIILAAIPLNFLIPVAVATAVMKYRLYEIDRIISRTVGYALVIGALGLIYAVGAVWLPSRFAGDSPLFVAGSTLAVAGLFNPTRRRALDWVDSRFYRSRFDAARVVEDFSNRLRSPTDPEMLTAQWIAVVSDTMQPSLISAWIKPESRASRNRSR